ncbi:MAG: AAA family ATPase, partial [Candidatus Krumholzibacteria bacterium]|nr:AAA family ATPase [Candidatus Krumholzibacteria bacterium]
ADHLFLEEVPTETFDDIGGLDEQAQRLRELVQLHLDHPKKVGKYNVRRDCGALLEGPPGTGKTMLVKGLVSYLRERSPSGKARFIFIRPGELSSMWFSKTEQRIRQVFKLAREAAAADPSTPVVIFFDEIDWIASSRSGHIHGVEKRAVVTLGSEMDGLVGRGNIMVIGATNRKHDLSAALIRAGRLGDEPITVGRPNRAAARSILSKYFVEDIPYATDGSSQAEARDNIIESAVSRLYSPNGEGEVATVVYRDGERRTIRIHEIMSGAMLAHIAQKSLRGACLREIETEEEGVTLSDVFTAIEAEIENAASLLTPANSKRYVAGLRQDVDVVSVEKIERKTAQIHHYLRVA